MLSVSHLRKQYATVLAVDDVSLEVRRGEILGLIGPNGAGKTTTIRMILNVIQPDSGSITFDGKSFDENIRNMIGYLPEERGLYRKNKLLNTILYFATLKGIDVAEGKRRAYQWLQRFDLLSYHDRKVEELSKGNQQKVQFIISILHNPQLVVLDEPFSGLDPINQILLKDILLELKQQEKAVIFSTHQMEQAEKLSDEICLINRGKMVLDGSLKDVKQKFGKNSVHLEFDGSGAFLKELPFVRQATVYENYAELVLNDSVTSTEIIAALSPKLEIRKFEYIEPSLNSIFIEVVGIPAVAEQPKPVQQVVVKPQSAATARNGRLKKALASLIITSVVTVVLFAALAFKPTISWTTPALFLAITLISLYRYLKTRRDVAAEMQKKSEAAVDEK
jgi:ABC-2 type transport system ATP-binding protein